MSPYCIVLKLKICYWSTWDFRCSGSDWSEVENRRGQRKIVDVIEMPYVLSNIHSKFWSSAKVLAGRCSLKEYSFLWDWHHEAQLKCHRIRAKSASYGNRCSFSETIRLVTFVVVRTISLVPATSEKPRSFVECFLANSVRKLGISGSFCLITKRFDFRIASQLEIKRSTRIYDRSLVEQSPGIWNADLRHNWRCLRDHCHSFVFGLWKSMVRSEISNWTAERTSGKSKKPRLGCRHPP